MTPTPAVVKLRYKVGDMVRVKSALSETYLVGKQYRVIHVGPWEQGEIQPNGGVCMYPADYIIDTGFGGDIGYAPGIQCREDNLE